MKVKAITLWEPWATAMRLQLKKIETRHWKTDYRGPLAIHAAQRLIDPPEEFSKELRDYIRSHGLVEKCSYGNVLCIVDLYDVRRTEQLIEFVRRELIVGNPEVLFGNYSPQRYGWLTRKCFALEKPIPAAGKQGLWNWDVPLELEHVVNKMVAEAMVA